ncbi:MAG: tRNA lysidine(34) synthetase TilS [Chloroflexi bacterium]|nr:tRNA lysidine(34) synthetase TilS [Chloroflexota bacterium]
MLKRVRNTLLNNKILAREKPILVGVSGGYDSLSLLHILHQLNYSLIAAYFNHELRIEANDEELKVEKFAVDLGIPFICGGQNVGSYAAQHRLSIEEAARKLRYGYLFEKAEVWQAQAVAVGHNADDQVETVLMHLLRGTGLDGLLGMQTSLLPNSWSDDITLLRPLLSIWRSEILDYCNHYNLQPIIDSSNVDEKYFRNRLRHSLIPIIEEYAPHVSERIWRMAVTLVGDYDIVTQSVDLAWENCYVEQGAGYIAFKVKNLRKQTLGVQRRLVRLAVKKLRANMRDLDFDAVERATAFLRSPSHSKQIDFCLGLRLILEGEQFYIATWESDLPNMSWPQLEDKNLGKLSIPGKLILSNGWIFSASFVENMEQTKELILENRNPFQAWIFFDCRKSTMTLRLRQPGDRFSPLGMHGKTVKISDYMINKKIPRRARTAWPLVCINGEIAWVPGFHLGESYKISSKTKYAVHLELIRKNINDEENQNEL